MNLSFKRDVLCYPQGIFFKKDRVHKIDDLVCKLGKVGSKLAFKGNFFFPTSIAITAVVVGTLFFQMFAVILAK